MIVIAIGSRYATFVVDSTTMTVMEIVILRYIDAYSKKPSQLEFTQRTAGHTEVLDFSQDVEDASTVLTHTTRRSPSTKRNSNPFNRLQMPPSIAAAPMRA